MSTIKIKLQIPKKPLKLMKKQSDEWKKTNQLKKQEKTQVDALKKLIEKTRINLKKTHRDELMK